MNECLHWEELLIHPPEQSPELEWEQGRTWFFKLIWFVLLFGFGFFLTTGKWHSSGSCWQLVCFRVGSPQVACISASILYHIVGGSVEKATLHPLFLSHLVGSSYTGWLCSNKDTFCISVWFRACYRWFKITDVADFVIARPCAPVKYLVCTISNALMPEVPEEKWCSFLLHWKLSS